jgi:hypothetical protein
MKVNYTLPGLLPEATAAPATESGERPASPFATQLQRLRAPEIADWRALLRLNIPPAGATGIGPPPAPNGIDLRDGVSQRAWWRGMLHGHMHLLESAGQDAASGTETDSHPPVQRMLESLLESQRREDEIFARHFAEDGD